MYYSLFLTWRYVPKSIPILSITANSLSNFFQYITKSTKLSLYEQSYEPLLTLPSVHTENNFSSISSKELQIMSYPMVNKIYSEYLDANLCNYFSVYTDGPVFPFSAGY